MSRESVLRFGGAQIPVTPSVSTNVETIKEAIDWAKENDVDFLITPEGSLSGYIVDWDFDEVAEGLKEIEEYTAEKEIGLCLGTLWKEKTNLGDIKRNQIRFYQSGLLFGVTNKTYTIEHDNSLPHDLKGEGLYYHRFVNKYGNGLVGVGLICNDMWGNNWSGGPNIAKMAQESRITSLLIHSTNGTRGNDMDDMLNTWHDIHLRMLSRASGIPIITVDNCIHMEGRDYNGRTSSESGVVINGEWRTSVPRYGKQYFYHDFNIDNIYK